MSGCDSWQADGGIIAQRSDGFQAHVACALHGPFIILFQQQRTWAVQRPLQPLMAISKQAGLSETEFNECLKNQQVLDGIEEVRQRAATKLNVQSTPTFFINGKQLRGAATLDEFEKEMAPYLKG